MILHLPHSQLTVQKVSIIIINLHNKQWNGEQLNEQWHKLVAVFHTHTAKWYHCLNFTWEHRMQSNWVDVKNSTVEKSGIEKNSKEIPSTHGIMSITEII